MKKSSAKRKKKISSFVLLISAVMVLGGCSGKESGNEEASSDTEISASQSSEEESKGASDVQEPAAAPVIENAVWSGYFDGLNGAAVVYDPERNYYQIYNQELAETRRSPCSTFKVISSAVGLEHGIIAPEDSVRAWSGEIYWNADWNRDIGFEDAFRTSCVWYFRQVVDEIGADLMESVLSRLQYGNCDISDWAGTLNTNTDNRDQTGFWIESSLLISPREQTEVMERIFGSSSQFSEETQEKLKEVMLVTDLDTAGVPVYGKTGLGVDGGTAVDAWFTGFADIEGERRYFCVYLGETEGAEVTSGKAKEIAVEILSSLRGSSPGE